MITSIKLAQLLEPSARNGGGNQQPELAGMLSNGSETDRASRTEVDCDTKNTLEIFIAYAYNSAYAVIILGEV